MAAGETRGRSDLYAALDAFQAPGDDAEGRDRTLRLVRDYFTAIDRKDADALRPLQTDDVRVELPFNESGRVEDGFFRVYQGIDEVMAFWTTAFAAEGTSAGLLNAEVHMSADGGTDFVEAFGRMTMPSGRDYRNRYVMRIRVNDGKVAGVREYYNPIISAYAFGRPIAGRIEVDQLPEA